MPREIKPPSRYVTEDGLLPQLASRVSTPQTSAKKGKPSRGSSSAPTPRSTRIPMGRNVNDSIVIGDDDDSDVEIVEPPTRFLKRKRDEDKDPDWGTSRKMAKSSKPLDRSGARAPSSRTPHPSHSRAVPPSKTPQTASTRTPQAPGSRTPQTQGSRTPQIPGSRTPQTHGSRTPQTQGSRTTPQTTGSRTPQTTGSRTPQVPGSKTPQTSVKTSHMPLWKTPQSSTSKAATPSRTAQATRTSQSSKVPPNRTPQYSRTPHPSALQSQLQASQRAQPRSAPAGGYKTASAWKQQRSPAPNSISKQGQDKVASSHVDLHMECYEEALSTVQVQTAKREQLAYEKSQMLIRAAQEGRLLFTPTGDPKVLKKPYQPPKHVKTPTPPPSQLLPIPAPVPLISPPQATSLLSVAAYQGAPHVVSGGMPEFSSLLSGVTTSVGMPGLMPTSVFAPVLGTYGLGVRLPPWQAIPPPPPLSPPPAPAPPKPTANQAQKKGGQQKGKNSSLYSTNMSRTQAEVLALLRSKKKKEDSKKTPPKAKRAEADMQKTKEKPRKRKTKDVEKEVPRQNTPDEGGKAKSIAEPPKRNRERKQTHQEMDETSGNWVPLGEYYYGKMEGDPTYKETKGDFRFKCWYCNKILLSNVAAMLHIQGHIDSEKQVNLDLNDLTSCKHCYKNFNTPFEMQTHIEKVHSNKANVLLCRICEKDHDSHHALREHMKRNHNACEMPYTCQLCKFRSSMYSDVVDHFKKKHSNTSSLLCLYCLKTLTVRSNNQGWGQTLNYYNHVLKHQIKNCTKKCSLCKLVFHSASTLKAHRQTDHLPNQRGVMATRSKQKASDEVMIKIAGDLGGASSGTGRSSRTLGGGGGGGAGGWASPSVSGVRSLNVPAVKKFVEHHVIIPAQAQKAKCVECDKTMGKPEHYKKYMQCSMCRYASSCTLAYNNHMLGFHSGQEAAVAALHIPTDRPMMKELYCECGFSSPYGNKLANHLVSCSKSSCYKTPPPPPSGDNFGNMRPETPPQEPVEMPEVDEVSRPARRPSLLMGAKKSSKPASLKDKADPVKPDKDSEPLPTSGKSAGDMEKVHIKMEAESYSGGEKPNKKEVKIVEKTGDASEEKIEERKQELQDEKKEDEDLMESCESRRKSEKVADKVQGLTENVEELKEGSKEEFKEKEEQDDESRAMKNEQNALKENIKEEKPSDGEEKEGSTEFSSIIKERSGPELGSSTQVDAPAVTGATTSDKAGVLKSSLVDYNSESDEEDSDNIPEVGETEVLKPTEPEETVGSDKENGELRASIVETRESGEDSRATIEGDEGKSGEADVKEAEQRENVEMEEGSGIEDESRDNEGEEPEAGESTHKGADVGAAMDKRGAETRGQTDEDIDSQLSADQELNTSLEQAVPSDEDGESKDTRTSVGEPAMEEENTADTADSNVVGGDGGADPKLGEEDSTTGTDFADEGTRITNEDDSESSSLKAPEVDTGEENGTADRQVSPKQSQSFNHNFVPGLNSLGEGSCDAKDWTGRFPHAESTNDEAIGDKGDGPSLAGALSERVFEHTSGEQRKMTEELERSSDIDSDSQTKSEVKAPTLNIGEGSVISSEEEDKKEEEEEEMDINLGEIGRGGEKSLDADSLDRSTTQGIEWPAESQEASDIQRETTQNKNEEENFNEVDERDNHSQQESNTESMQDASSQGVLLPQNIPESASLEEAHENSTIDKEKSMEAEEEDMPLQTQAVHEEDTHKDLNLQDSEAVREEMSASVSASETPKDSDADHESRKSFSWGSGAEGFVPQPTSSTTVEQSSVRPSTSHSSAYSGEGHRDRSRSRERRRSRSRDKRSRSRDRRSRSRSRDRQRERDRDRRRERDRHHRDRDRDRHHDRDRDRHRDRRDRSRDRDRRDRSRDRDRDRRDRSRERDRERDRDRDRERDRDYYKHRDDRRHR